MKVDRQEGINDKKRKQEVGIRNKSIKKRERKRTEETPKDKTRQDKRKEEKRRGKKRKEEKRKRDSIENQYKAYKSNIKKARRRCQHKQKINKNTLTSSLSKW